VLYLEGTALPKAVITVLLEENGSEIKKWQTSSDINGRWFFSTKELIEPGAYYLSAMAEDDRGAMSLFSDPKEIEIIFNGLATGGLLIAFSKIILISIFVLLLGFITVLYLFLKNYRSKKILKKEIKEAEESLIKNFSALKEELEKKISLIDSKPGFNAQEKELYEEVENSLYAAEEAIKKEIMDIERELE
jgi:hypothetical protein